MSKFSKLISFESQDGKARYFADLGAHVFDLPKVGATIDAYPSFSNLVDDKGKLTATFGKVTTLQPIQLLQNYRRSNTDWMYQQVLSPLPGKDLPIYSVGLNYRSHAKEANVRDHGRPRLQRC